MLTCYNCPLRHYDYFLTPYNIPTFMNCTIVATTEKCCSLNFFSDDNGKTSKLSAFQSSFIESEYVPYISTGFDVPKSFDDKIGLGILYQCITDNCNNPQTILKPLLKATKIETYKPPQLSLEIQPSSSAETFICSTFSNFTSVDQCRPSLRNRQSSNTDEACSTYCVTAIKSDQTDLTNERMCSYCEYQPTENFLYIDERIHVLNRRTSYLLQLQYLCNATNNCNSLENIRQIQQRYKIEFDFDVFFASNGTRMIILSGTLQYTIYLLFIVFISFK